MPGDLTKFAWHRRGKMSRCTRMAQNGRHIIPTPATCRAYTSHLSVIYTSNSMITSSLMRPHTGIMAAPWHLLTWQGNMVARTRQPLTLPGVSPIRNKQGCAVLLALLNDKMNECLHSNVIRLPDYIHFVLTSFSCLNNAGSLISGHCCQMLVPSFEHAHWKHHLRIQRAAHAAGMPPQQEISRRAILLGSTGLSFRLQRTNSPSRTSSCTGSTRCHQGTTQRQHCSIIRRRNRFQQQCGRASGEQRSMFVRR